MENNLTFQLIRDENFKGLPELEELYESSFPEAERRTFAKLLTLLQEPDMYLHAVQLDNTTVGMSVHWLFEEFTYLEHLAIVPAFQGRRIGQQATKWLLTQSPHPVVLEVERPLDSFSKRRIGFYERLGFFLHSRLDYHQPPYAPGADSVPMYLMSRPMLPHGATIQKIADQLREQVFERFY